MIVETISKHDLERKKISPPTQEERIALMEKFIRKNPGIKSSTLRMAIQSKDYSPSLFGADLAKIKAKNIGLIVNRPKTWKEENTYTIDDSKAGKKPDPVQDLINKEATLKEIRPVDKNFFNAVVGKSSKPINPIHIDSSKEKSKEEKIKKSLEYKLPETIVLPKDMVLIEKGEEIKNVSTSKINDKIKQPKFQVGDSFYRIFDDFICKEIVIGVMPVITKNDMVNSMEDLIIGYKYLINPSPESLPNDCFDFVPDTFESEDSCKISQKSYEHLYFESETEMFATKEDLIEYIKKLP